MRERLIQLQTRIDELSLRERGMLFITLLAVLVFAWHNLLMQPLNARQQSATTRTAELGTEIADLDRQARQVVQQANLDPDLEERRLLEALQRQQEGLDQRIAEVVSGLLSPPEMALALEQVLDENRSLKFVAMENLPVRPVLDEPQQAASMGLYRHGLRVRLEGDYLSTLNYLRALEALEWNFYWDSIELSMEAYPNAQITLTVHTLSLDEGWIGG